MRQSSFAVLVCLALGACAGPQTDGPSFGSTKPPAPFVLAVYNKDNLLATDPVRDMKVLLDDAEKRKARYTDVYIVSHGWNYTPSEALGAYERYHAKLVEFLAEQQGDGELPATMSDDGERFKPLMVYVAWNSVARPLSELTSSILPFGLDEAISSPTQIIDSTVFFLPSVWKQSLNAYGNAIGRHDPDDYLERGQAQITSRELVLKGNSGYDVPLSEVVYEAMRHSEGNELDVHLVGHSFGAKLVALAGIEALRRYDITHGDGALDGRLDSMVLFNAAFRPQELSYRTDDPTCNALDPLATQIDEAILGDEVDALLTHVPGKAMVYSNQDFAAGLLFDISQLFVNTAVAQSTHQVAAEPTEVPVPGDAPSGILGTTWRGAKIVFKGSSDLVVGTVGLGLTVAASVIEWPVRKVVNVFEDFPHHVAERDGWAGIPSTDRNLLASAGACVWNAITFFVPFEALSAPTETLYGGVADQRGLYRHTLPALGRTGIAGLWRGRHAVGVTSPPLRSFAFDTDGDERPDAEAPRDFFANYVVDHDRSTLGPFLGGERFTSFDATAAYDSLMPFVGAHGDLRSSDEYETPQAGGEEVEKIDATLRFVLDWTREAGDLDG